MLIATDKLDFMAQCEKIDLHPLSQNQVISYMQIIFVGFSSFWYIFLV